MRSMSPSGDGALVIRANRRPCAITSPRIGSINTATLSVRSDRSCNEQMHLAAGVLEPLTGKGLAVGRTAIDRNIRLGHALLGRERKIFKVLFCDVAHNLCIVESECNGPVRAGPSRFLFHE
jgi:hypothetical protein